MLNSISIIFLFLPIVLTLTMLHSGESDYSHQRAHLLYTEKKQMLGGQLVLSPKELDVQRILLARKREELEAAYKNSSTFLPSMHFFHSKPLIEQSEIFKIIRQAPKGASLHTHLLAGVSIDFLMDISYRPGLYGGYVNNVFKLKFLSGALQDDRCEWKEIKELRRNQTPEVFDDWLRGHFQLNVDKPQDAYPSSEAVWMKFKQLFTTTYDMLCYKPVFEEYIHQVLQELHSDNVMYTEVKGTIMPLYELSGDVYSKKDFFEIFINTVEEFRKKHPSFVGLRYIHSIYRGVEKDVLKDGLEEIIQMKKSFPDFIAGFDFVGFEEEGKRLVDYHEELLEAQKDLKFFFHAGESPWFGHTDLNLADAILLNSSRIGHGFALHKHPALLQLARERDIAMEICPISNQVLMLNDDPRTHPANQLFAMSYPLVVCNDDPTAWNSSGLSYDWYIAFMAMAPKKSGLEVLKQLAINSIKYSSVSNVEKIKMTQNWEEQWDAFLDYMLSVNKNVP